MEFYFIDYKRVTKPLKCKSSCIQKKVCIKTWEMA